MSIQPWSQRGSNVSAVTRPWTGIVMKNDGDRVLVYCEAARRDEANALLERKANGGQLIASIFGHHDPSILILV